ncbi:MAG: putative quinol monooxygenase [Acidimicrobiia bacterium]
MSKVSVVAKLTIKADRADGFPAAWDAFLEHVDANESGTEHYMLHRSNEVPNEFYVTELYADQAALDEHMASGAFAEFGASLGDFIENADLQFLTPVKAAKGQL